jgi:hypothetical protein
LTEHPGAAVAPAHVAPDARHKAQNREIVSIGTQGDFVQGTTVDELEHRPRQVATGGTAPVFDIDGRHGGLGKI